MSINAEITAIQHAAEERWKGEGLTIPERCACKQMACRIASELPLDTERARRALAMARGEDATHTPDHGDLAAAVAYISMLLPDNPALRSRTLDYAEELVLGFISEAVQ